MSTSPVETPEMLTLTWLPYIERAATSLCRRHGLSKEETEDFVGGLRCKLFDNDCEVARKYQGRSKLTTYFHTVVANAFRDWQDSHWGKWRPSAEALRMGEVAVQLDRLLTRDGHTFAEACRILRDNHKVALSEAELDAMAARLPPRTQRRFEDEERLQETPTREEGPEASLLRHERAELRRRLIAALTEAIEKLPTEDRLIVRLRFEKGMSLADIARGMKAEEKPFYVRFKRILRGLRDELELQGFRREDLGDLFEGD